MDVAERRPATSSVGSRTESRSISPPIPPPVFLPRIFSPSLVHESRANITSLPLPRSNSACAATPSPSREPPRCRHAGSSGNFTPRGGLGLLTVAMWPPGEIDRGGGAASNSSRPTIACVGRLISRVRQVGHVEHDHDFGVQARRRAPLTVMPSTIRAGALPADPFRICGVPSGNFALAASAGSTKVASAAAVEQSFGRDAVDVGRDEQPPVDRPSTAPRQPRTRVASKASAMSDRIIAPARRSARGSMDRGRPRPRRPTIAARSACRARRRTGRTD